MIKDYVCIHITMLLLPGCFHDDVIKPKFTGEFPVQKQVTHSFDVFFDLRLNKRLSKQTIDTPVIWNAITLIMTSLLWFTTLKMHNWQGRNRIRY